MNQQQHHGELIHTNSIFAGRKTSRQDSEEFHISNESPPIALDTAVTMTLLPAPLLVSDEILTEKEY